MSYALSILFAFAVAATLAGLLKLSRKRARENAATVDEALLLEARAVPARVFLDHDILGGPTAGKINRAAADLVLTAQRLVVATHQGRILELRKDQGGSVRSTGPGRLVIEGVRMRSGGNSKVRIELHLMESEDWARSAAAALATSKSALAG
ncbi:MAG TPA: hypothetical protein QGF58_16185 [Myxococcota bacterium]|nr:hypothetical protein [Myxococcota bacterium]